MADQAATLIPAMLFQTQRKVRMGHVPEGTSSAMGHVAGGEAREGALGGGKGVDGRVPGRPD